VVARDVARRAGFSVADADLVACAVRHHLLLPRTAVRRDLDDPVTVAQVAGIIGSRVLLDLLHALAIADGQATGPAAWSDWKAGLVAELVERVSAELSGEPPGLPVLPSGLLELAASGRSEALVSGGEVTVVAPDRHGLLWQAAGVLASHRLVVRSANVFTRDAMAVTVLRVAPEFGDPPDAGLVAGDLRRMLDGRLDVAERLRRRSASASGGHHGLPGVPPPKVTLVDDASRTATVVEIRAHDEPGLLWRMGRALGECGLDVRAARVETLGAEAVDVFYVVDGAGRPVKDLHLRGQIAARVLEALTS
jgi:[protein-PII] uridylyltransferase